MRVVVAYLLLCIAAGSAAADGNDMKSRLAGYATVRLTADVQHLGAGDRAMLPLLIESA